MLKPDISIIIDTKTSWLWEHIDGFVKTLSEDGYFVIVSDKYEEVIPGGIAIFLSCEKLAPKKILQRSIHNLVVHQSDLPHGRGWSPITWQVLEGKSIIPTTLFEADESADSGAYYLKSQISLEGHELLPEIKKKQAENDFEMIMCFLSRYPHVPKYEQYRRGTYYKRRTPKDSELNPKKSIASQFNLLRVCDNKRYPAFFNYAGHKYVLNIWKVD